MGCKYFLWYKYDISLLVFLLLVYDAYLYGSEQVQAWASWLGPLAQSPHPHRSSYWVGPSHPSPRSSCWVGPPSRSSCWAGPHHPSPCLTTAGCRPTQIQSSIPIATTRGEN